MKNFWQSPKTAAQGTNPLKRALGQGSVRDEIWELLPAHEKIRRTARAKMRRRGFLAGLLASAAIAVPAFAANNVGPLQPGSNLGDLNAPGTARTNLGIYIIDIKQAPYFAKGDGVTNDAPAINAALATGMLCYAPAGTYLCNSEINLVDGGGLFGVQGANFVRNFSGNPLLYYPGGNFITLKNIQVSCAAGITPVFGDSGVQLGFGTSWSGRGDIANLLIIGQWVGFEWEGGVIDAMFNILTQNNLSHGFRGISAAQLLDSCTSQFNSGDGFHWDQIAGGQPMARYCTSFANTGYGYNLATFSGDRGANAWVTECVSSFDNMGGIYINGPSWTQVWMANLLIEYAGQANTWAAGYSSKQTAPTANASGRGMTLGATALSSFFANNILINASNGPGAFISNLSNGIIDGLQIINSGQAGNNSGLTISACTNLNITGLQANGGGAQTLDVDVVSSSTVKLVGAELRTYSTDNTNTVQFVGRSQSITSSTTVASASSMRIPDYSDTLVVSGTTTINNIVGSLVADRRITLTFQSASCQVSNSGNVAITPYTSSLGSSLTLVYDGSLWRQG